MINKFDSMAQSAQTGSCDQVNDGVSPEHIMEASLADELDGGSLSRAEAESPGDVQLLIPRVNFEGKRPINSPVVVLAHKHKKPKK